MGEGARMKRLLLAVSTLTLGFAAPAMAQDHSGHGETAPAPAAEPEVDHANMDHSHGLETAEVGPEPDPPAGDYCVVSLEGGGQMACRDPDNPSQPDHSQMDHSQMDHGVAAEGPVDHTAMGHAQAERPVEASGTSRLPQAEGMMPGIHFD